MTQRIAPDPAFPFLIVRNEDDRVLWHVDNRPNAEAHLAKLRSGFARIVEMADTVIDGDDRVWLAA